MKSKVFYVKSYKHIDFIAKKESSCIILCGGDGWDDYGYKTTLKLYIFKNGERYDYEGRGYIRKLFFEEQKTGDNTSNILNKLCDSNFFVKFEDIYKKYNFISLGSEYEDLKKIYPNEFNSILEVLNDIIYLEKNKPHNKLLELKEHEAFNVSLCRDQNVKKTLSEARAILYDEVLDSNRFKFTFQYILNNRQYEFNLDFISNVLPYRVNIVIGKNGVGKTKFLEILSKYFLYNTQIDKKLAEYYIKVNNNPTFISNIISISFNVYENFELDINNNRFDVKNYKYLGYRNNEGKIDPNYLELTAFNSLKNIYKRDIENFSKEIFLYEEPYVNRIINILNKAFGCKYIGFKLQSNNKQIILDINTLKTNEEYKDLLEDIQKKIFFLNGEYQEINLSSGQKTFANMVMNIIGSIKKNSLILIDEPENTLHPNYEIDFMNILFDILEEFDSFAIIATHSSIITREVPKKYVNIIKINSENEIVVINPAIETFGANIMDINNLVFNDIFKENKPFEKWLRKQFEVFLNFEDFYNEFNELLSYDFMLEAKRVWSDLNGEN